MSLDDIIDACHARIGGLMHEQSARPNNANIGERIAAERETLLALQRERADEMSAYFDKTRIRPLDEDIAFLREARSIRERYECEAAHNKPALEWAEYYNPVRCTAEQLGIEKDVEQEGNKLMFILSGRRL